MKNGLRIELWTCEGYMKRSDMVEKMMGHWRGSQSFKSDRNMFDYILHRMEEVGMVPPFYDKIQNNNGDEVVIPCREWEPEDD